MIAPVMEKLSVDFPQASFYKIDVDEREVVAQDAGIRSMPTFLFFKNGKKICEVIGANSAALRVRSSHIFAFVHSFGLCAVLIYYVQAAVQNNV